LTVGLRVGLGGLFSRRPIWVGRVVGATVAVGVLLGAATPLRTAMAERDYPGAVAFFEAFDEALPAEAWVVVDYPGVGAALRFLRGRVAFQWDGWRAGSWDDLLKAVEEAAEEVPMLHFATLSPLNEIKPHWMEVGRVPIDTRLTVQDPRQWRRASRALKSTLYVYQVGPSERELR
ncbi:MAG TPA: hypothetical protein PKE55_11205, partial [Kiritimatiellia bacterium]|nr:hypothetical protein [Kiritimatiellia bacterium]